MSKKIVFVLFAIFVMCLFYGKLDLLSASDDVSDKPMIEITPDSWNFGKVKNKELKIHIFKLKNKGGKELIIERVSTSCGCTSAEISKNKIAPGKSADLKVTFDPKKTHSKGKVRRDVYIESNDPKEPTKIIAVYADLGTKTEQKERIPQPKPTKPSAKPALSPEITSSELYSRKQKGEEIVILDVREENEYIAKHIPDAIWFPKSKFDKKDPEVLKKLEKIDKKTVVTTYCGAGHRSNYVAKKLREMGYNAFNLDGLSFWEKKGYPLIYGPKLPPSLEPSIIHLEEAFENYYVLFKDIVWVDVRNSEDYDQGHVKGALGIPLSEIESRLNEIPRDKEVVLYCEGTWDGGSCEASRSAGRILIKNGFKQGKIKVFEDGYGAWENAGYPIETKDAKINPQDIYRQILCEHCNKPIYRSKCAHSRQMKAYIEGLIDAGLLEDEIFINIAKKFGIGVLLDKDRQAKVKAEILEKYNNKYPVISVVPEKYDFGRVSMSKGIVKAKFSIINTGKDILNIDNIKTSCGCTTASLKIADGKKGPEFGMKGKTDFNWQVEILPGEEAELVVNFDPKFHPIKKFPHKVTRTITISSNDPIAPKKSIKLNVEIIK